MRLLLLGAPGSGKGTQGVLVAERYDVPHISTGELLRSHVHQGTDLGRTAQPYMNRGDLLPDELILSIALEQLIGPNSPEGYVLDGFPRTVPQAEAAYEAARQAGLTLDAVVFLEIPHDELMSRLDERARHEGRRDDREATVRHRIEVYEDKTLPLLDYYALRGILIRVDAVGSVDIVTARIFHALDCVHPGDAINA